MASIFSHALTSYAFGQFIPTKRMLTWVLLLGVLSAILPDIDVIAYEFGIDDDQMLGHRGLTHSIPFAIAWAIILVALFHKNSDRMSRNIYRSYYFICMCSHGILDAMTTGGEGVAFFAPFSPERTFLPWRIIKVSPIGAADFFSEWGVRVLLNEAVVVGIPCIVLILMAKVIRRI